MSSKELLQLLRFQLLDARNGTLAGEPDAIRLCGAAADEIERLRAEQEACDGADHSECDPGHCEYDRPSFSPRPTRAELLAEIERLRAALERFVCAAKSWHDTHNHAGSPVQCDWLCECIPQGEAALAGRAVEKEELPRIAKSEAVASVTRSAAPDAADKGASSRGTDVKPSSASAAVARHGVDRCLNSERPAEGSAPGGTGSPEEASECRLTLDTAHAVYFYEQDHYYLSNFSAFMVEFGGSVFPTSEHAYHWLKFPDDVLMGNAIRRAFSAHEAFKMAERWKQYRRADWDAVKIDLMRDILRAKAAQHEYVRRKLLQTGDRELIENSWRDDYWGWGPKRDGQNMLGKLWMELRSELRRAEETGGSHGD